MNEQIRKLYEQAHIERRQEYFSSVVDPTIKSVSVTRHFNLDLFAELIIAECEVALKPPVQVRDVISRGQAYDLIKKHFGVKE